MAVSIATFATAAEPEGPTSCQKSEDNMKEVCTGDEFFKYRQLNEDALANAILRLNSGDFPTLICGHSHEPRDRSKFHNTKGHHAAGEQGQEGLHPVHEQRFRRTLREPDLVYRNHRNNAKIHSWSNSGTKSKMVAKKMRWDSNDKGKLLGTEVKV